MRVQVPNALLGLFAHPRAVAAHVFGQAAGTAPVVKSVLRRLLGAALGLNLRPHRRTARELGRYLDHGLVDGHGHGVEVRSMAFQPQALRF